MSYIRAESLTITTDTTSTATAYTPALTGKFHSLEYRPGTTAYSTSIVLTVTVEGSSQVILSTTAFNTTTMSARYPRSIIHNTAGTTIVGDAQFALADERVKVVIDSAGATKDGIFRILVE